MRVGGSRSASYLTAFLLALGAVSAGAQRDDNCPPRYRRDPAATARAREAKKAVLRREGFPERFMSLLDKEECVACVEMASDAFHIQIEYAPGQGPENDRGGHWTSVSFQWDPLTEREVRQDIRAGKVLRYRIYNTASACQCCDTLPAEQRPDWDPVSETNTSQQLLFDGPNNLGPEPPELTQVPPQFQRKLPPPHSYQKPAKRQAHTMCPACRGLEAQVNAKYDTLDYLWNERIAKLKQYDLGRRIIVQRDNEIARLQFLNGTRPQADISAKIDELRKVNDQQQEGLEYEARRIVEVDESIRQTQGELDAALQKLRECEAKCATTTQTAVGNPQSTIQNPQSSGGQPSTLKDSPTQVGARDVSRLRRADAAVALGGAAKPTTANPAAVSAAALGRAVGRTVTANDRAMADAQALFDSFYGPPIYPVGQGIAFPFGQGIARFTAGAAPSLVIEQIGQPAETIGTSNGEWTNLSANLFKDAPIVAKGDTLSIRGSADSAFDSGTLTFSASSPHAVFVNDYGANWSINPSNGNSSQILEFGGEVGFPIVKDRLWFWGAGDRDKIAGPSALGVFPDQTALQNDAGKLTSLVNANNDANLAFRLAGGVNLAPTLNLFQNTYGNRWTFASSQGMNDVASHLDGSHFKTLDGLDNDFKFGFSYRHTPVESASFWDGGGQILDLRGQVIPAPTAVYQAVENRQLTEDPGVAFNLITPRIGVQYQVADKMLVKANYAMYADQIGVAMAANVNPVAYTYFYAYFNDANPTVNEPTVMVYGPGIDPDNPNSLANVIDPDLQSPKTHEIVLGLTQQVGRDTSVGVSGTWRARYDETWKTPFVQYAAAGSRVVSFSDWLVDGSAGSEAYQYFFLEGAWPVLEGSLTLEPSRVPKEHDQAWYEMPVRWLASWFRLPQRIDAAPAFASKTSLHVARRLPEYQAPQGNGAASAVPKAMVTIKATGASTGQAFTLEVLNPTDKPFAVAVREGLVIQPVRTPRAPAPPPASAKLIKQPLRGYCLDFVKPPPPEGVSYKVSDQATQQKFRPLRDVLRAARRLQRAGKLGPDGPNAASYLDATKQWALWTKLENWDARKFADMFLERTKKNLTEMKVNVTKEIENQIKAAIPARWQHVQAVLAEAAALGKAGKGDD